MIKIENTETYGWEAAIRGMRNPMNSWDKIDTKICDTYKVNECCDRWCDGKCRYHNSCGKGVWVNEFQSVHLGENDLDLMKQLRNAGTDHRKFMRMITVYCDVTAPLYWQLLLPVKHFSQLSLGVAYAANGEPTIGIPWETFKK